MSLTKLHRHGHHPTPTYPAATQKKRLTITSFMHLANDTTFRDHQIHLLYTTALNSPTPSNLTPALELGILAWLQGEDPPNPSHLLVQDSTHALHPTSEIQNVIGWDFFSTADSHHFGPTTIPTR